MWIDGFRMWGREAPHVPFRLFRRVRDVRDYFGQISLGISSLYRLTFMLRALTTSISSRIGRREGLHVVHQGVPHANIMTLCMWHVYKCLHDEVEVRCMKMTFMLDCLWDLFLNSDKYQQQVRLAVRVARTRGAVWSGV